MRIVIVLLLRCSLVGCSGNAHRAQATNAQTIGNDLRPSESADLAMFSARAALRRCDAQNHA